MNRSYSNDDLRFAATCGPLTQEEKEYLIKKGQLFETSEGLIEAPTIIYDENEKALDAKWCEQSQLRAFGDFGHIFKATENENAAACDFMNSSNSEVLFHVGNEEVRVLKRPRPDFSPRTPSGISPAASRMRMSRGMNLSKLLIPDEIFEEDKENLTPPVLSSESHIILTPSPLEEDPHSLLLQTHSSSTSSKYEPMTEDVSMDEGSTPGISSLPKLNVSTKTPTNVGWLFSTPTSRRQAGINLQSPTLAAASKSKAYTTPGGDDTKSSFRSNSEMLNVTFDKDDDEEGSEENNEIIPPTPSQNSDQRNETNSDSLCVNLSSRIATPSILVNSEIENMEQEMSKMIVNLNESMSEKSFLTADKSMDFGNGAKLTTFNNLVATPATPKGRVKEWIRCSTTPSGCYELDSYYDPLSGELPSTITADSYESCSQSFTTAQKGTRKSTNKVPQVATRSSARLSSKKIKSFEEADKDVSIHKNQWEKFVLDYPGASSHVHSQLPSLSNNESHNTNNDEFSNVSLTTTCNSEAFYSASSTPPPKKSFKKVSILEEEDEVEENNADKNEEGNIGKNDKNDDEKENISKNNENNEEEEDELDEIPETQEMGEDDENTIGKTRNTEINMSIDSESDGIRGTQGSSGTKSSEDLDDSIIRMDRLIALADELENNNGNNRGGDNDGGIMGVDMKSLFPPDIPCSYSEQVLGRKSREIEFKTLRNSFQSMDISSSPLFKNGEVLLSSPETVKSQVVEVLKKGPHVPLSHIPMMRKGGVGGSSDDVFKKPTTTPSADRLKKRIVESNTNKSTTPKFTSTPVGKGTPKTPSALVSPVSTIGFPTPPPKRTYVTLNSRTSGGRGEGGGGVVGQLKNSAKSAPSSPRVYNVSSPVANYVYSTPTPPLIATATSSKAYTHSLGRQIVERQFKRKLTTSGIPRVTPSAFSSSNNGLSSEGRAKTKSDVVKPLGRDVGSMSEESFAALEENYEKEKRAKSKMRLKEVHYKGSERVRQLANGSERRVNMEELKPPVLGKMASPVVAISMARDPIIHSQRHLGIMNESGSTSMIKQEQVIKSFIPSRIAKLSSKN